MKKKLLCLLLAAVMLFSLSLPAFALNNRNAIEIVRSQLWFPSATATYDVTDCGTYHRVVAANNGVVYTFDINDVDGYAELVSFNSHGSGLLTFLGVINAIVLKVRGMLPV